jgi:hypothetical protein
MAIEFYGGQLLERPGIQASNDYLKGMSIQIRIEGNKIIFPPLILDPDDNITITALLLAPKDSQIGIHALGKIAGQGAIPIADLSTEAQRPGYWAEVIEGRPTIQLGRALTYSIVTIVALIALGFSVYLGMGILGLPADWIDSNLEEADRKLRLEVAQKYIKENKLAFTPTRENLLKAYVFQKRRESGQFDQFIELVRNEDRPRGDGRAIVAAEQLRMAEGRGSRAESRRRNLEELRREVARFLEYLEQRSFPIRPERKERFFDVGLMYPPKEMSLDLDWIVEQESDIKF